MAGLKRRFSVMDGHAYLNITPPHENWDRKSKSQ